MSDLFKKSNQNFKLLIFLMIVIANVSIVQSFGTGGPFDIWPLHVHKDIAKQVLKHETIKPYLEKYNLNAKKIAHFAATEPQYHFGFHPSWTDFRSLAYLNWEMNETALGVLLHVAGDSGVGACHCPACEIQCSDARELKFEGYAELSILPKLNEVLQGTFQEKISQFHSDQIQLVTEYKEWWDNNTLCPWLCNPAHFSVRGVLNGMKLGQAALLNYFQSKEANLSQQVNQSKQSLIQIEDIN